MRGPLRVVGLDLSLTSTGMSEGDLHWVAQTSSDDPIEYRLDWIINRVKAITEPWTRPPAVLVVVEDGAPSKNAQPGHEELAALRLMVRHLLWSRDIPFAMVRPTTLKAYTTGSGTATKARMVQAVKDRHGIDLSGVMVKDGKYDMADAAALAAMGYAFIGQPLPTTGPPARMDSMLAVKWPRLPERD